MQNTHTQALADALNDHVGSFVPEHMGELDRYLADFPEAMHNGQTAFTALKNRLDTDHPVDRAVADMFTDVAAMFAGLRDQAEDIYRQWRTAHEHDLRRLEQPRQGETEWDKANSPV
jgi:hypothetical protein